MTPPPIVTVKGLRVSRKDSGLDIVDGVTFDVTSSNIVGIVGESGSGKTTVALAILGHTRRGLAITAGEIEVAGRDIRGATASQLRDIRACLVTYVPQDASSALNPALRIGAQISEVFRLANGAGWAAEGRQHRELLELIADLQLPTDTEFLRRYPHQLSGGQQQRVAIAMALAHRPSVIVLDEPTTGLDVNTQAHILEILEELCRRRGASAIFVSHDLAVVSRICDQVVVLYGGRLIERGPTRDAISLGAHPYTRGLVDAIPRIQERRRLVGIPGQAVTPTSRPEGCVFAPRCTHTLPQCVSDGPGSVSLSKSHYVACWRSNELPPWKSVVNDQADAQGDYGSVILSVDHLVAAHKGRPAVRDMSFNLLRGECLALVGESGSGKTTAARCIVGLHHEYTGDIEFHGNPLARDARLRPRDIRKSVQYVFQNPYGSLNPRKTIAQIIQQPLDALRIGPSVDRPELVAHVAAQVSLGSQLLTRYPMELSGGERQRAAIARALVVQPEVLICDEVTSSLDVSVQASIIELLRELQSSLSLSVLFITHSLPLTNSLANRVLVMKDGREIEQGNTRSVLTNPRHGYTKELLTNSPVVSNDREIHN